MKYRINNYTDLVSAFKRCKEEDLSIPHVLTFKEGKEKRKDVQNRLLYHWIGEINEQTKEGVDYIRGYFKWTYGCPILAAEDEEFNALYDALMDGYTYEEAIKLMGTNIVQVSSKMSVKQMSEYLTHIRDYGNERGLRLTTNEDQAFEALVASM